MECWGPGRPHIAPGAPRCEEKLSFIRTKACLSVKSVYFLVRDEGDAYRAETTDDKMCPTGD